METWERTSLKSLVSRDKMKAKEIFIFSIKCALMHKRIILRTWGNDIFYCKNKPPIIVFINRLDPKFEFSYLGQIEPTKYDDMTRFVEAMLCLGFSEKQQNIIFRVIAAILHGGNIDFSKVDDEKCVISNESGTHLNIFCDLLGNNLYTYLNNAWRNAIS